MMPKNNKLILLFFRVFNWIGLIVTVVGAWQYMHKFIDLTPRISGRGWPPLDGVLGLYVLFAFLLQVRFMSYKEEIVENRCGPKTVRNLILTVIVVNVFGFAFTLYVFHLCGYL